MYKMSGEGGHCLFRKECGERREGRQQRLLFAQSTTVIGTGLATSGGFGDGSVHFLSAFVELSVPNLKFDR